MSTFPLESKGLLWSTQGVQTQPGIKGLEQQTELNMTSIKQEQNQYVADFLLSAYGSRVFLPTSSFVNDMFRPLC